MFCRYSHSNSSRNKNLKFLKVINFYQYSSVLVSYYLIFILGTKLLQARLQQYVNGEIPDVQAGFRKGIGTRDQVANIH